MTFIFQNVTVFWVDRAFSFAKLACMQNDTFSLVIIDDEPSIRNGIRSIVEKEFPNIEILGVASDGQEGLSLIESTRPNMVISDIVMPKMTGLELLENVKRDWPKISFVLISGFDDFKYAQQAIRLGVSAYILKPINKNELISVLNKEMEKCSSISPYEMSDEAMLVASRMFLERLLRGEVKSEEEARRGNEVFHLNLSDGIKTLAVIDSTDNIDIPSAEGCLVHIYNKYTVLIIPSEQEYALHFCNQIYSRNKAISIGVGETTDELYNLHHSYQVALTALSYSLYSDEGGVYSEKDISNKMPLMGTSDIKTDSLNELLIAQDEIGIEKWIDSFISSLMYIECPPPNYVKGMCIFLLNDVIKRLSDTSMVTKECSNSINVTDINNINRISKLKAFLSGKLLYISKYGIPEAQMENDPIIHKARMIVKANPDRIVHASDVAKEVGMNATYFSTYYKNKTGETFRTYINRYRVEYAKKLLIETNLSVEEIGLQLGYSDYRSFNRIFKQLEGLAPSDYRKSFSAIK